MGGELTFLKQWTSVRMGKYDDAIISEAAKGQMICDL